MCSLHCSWPSVCSTRTHYCLVQNDHEEENQLSTIAYKPHTIWSPHLSTTDNSDSGPGHQPSPFPQIFMQLYSHSGLRPNVTSCETISWLTASFSTQLKCNSIRAQLLELQFTISQGDTTKCRSWGGGATGFECEMIKSQSEIKRLTNPRRLGQCLPCYLQPCFWTLMCTMYNACHHITQHQWVQSQMLQLRCKTTVCFWCLAHRSSQFLLS